MLTPPYVAKPRSRFNRAVDLALPITMIAGSAAAGKWYVGAVREAVQNAAEYGRAWYNTWDTLGTFDVAAIGLMLTLGFAGGVWGLYNAARGTPLGVSSR